MEQLAQHTEGVYALTTRSITVSVEPQYLHDQSDANAHQFVWAYHVRIENQGGETVQLKSRYWHITDQMGRVQEVSGAGVIGEQPVLAPGDSFEYSSGTPLGTASGIMRGHYVMESENAETFNVEIPAFSLDIPDEFHLVH